MENQAVAGGYSSRMGRDKAALPLGGRTLLEHQAEKLACLGLREVLISGWEGAVPGTRFVPDVYPHRGPLSGIHACLSAARTEQVLFLSVDVPLVPAETLAALLQAHTGGVTLLEHAGKWEPLLGVYDASLAPLAAQILQTERTAVRRLLEQCAVHMVPYTGDDRLLMNCNDPEAYAAVLALASAKGGTKCPLD